LASPSPSARLHARFNYKVVYDGGSVANEKPGTDMKLSIDGNNIRIKKESNEVIAIPASSVTALLALSKSKKHYVGIPWNDNGKKGGQAFQADKSDYRGLLTGLEGITGKKASILMP
jgi:hypothetical protein